jgi:hypothetical protein
MKGIYNVLAKNVQLLCFTCGVQDKELRAHLYSNGKISDLLFQVAIELF